MTYHKAVDLITAELTRAVTIHPDWPEDIVHAVAKLAEEAGEALAEANNFQEGGGDWNELRAELAQAGAMAIRCLVNLPE